MTKNKNRFIVLGLNDLTQEKNFGSFPSRKAAEVVVFAHIEEYKYGMGIVQRGMFGIVKQWNYTIDKDGKVWSRENHGDLW